MDTNLNYCPPLISLAKLEHASISINQERYLCLSIREHLLQVVCPYIKGEFYYQIIHRLEIAWPLRPRDDHRVTTGHSKPKWHRQGQVLCITQARSEVTRVYVKGHRSGVSQSGKWITVTPYLGWLPGFKLGNKVTLKSKLRNKILY